MNFAGLVITVALIAVSATFGACIGRRRPPSIDPELQAAIRNRATIARYRHAARVAADDQHWAGVADAAGIPPPAGDWAAWETELTRQDGAP